MIKLKLRPNSKLGHSTLAFALPPLTTCPKRGAICATCYARYGLYSLSPVARANYAAVSRLRTARAIASALLAEIQSHPDVRYIRWFSSGDCYSPALGRAIAMVAHDTPGIGHWVSTRIPSNFPKTCPPNLVIRVSSPSVEDWSYQSPTGNGATVAMPETTAPPSWHLCPGSCDPCRACWDPAVPAVAYRWHGSAVAKNILAKTLLSR